MAFELGDLVVLTSGSMRMAVEAADGDMIACVWCNEGKIGRDTFNAKLLKKWEMREDQGGHRGPPRGDRDDRGGPGGGRPPYKGDREGGGKPFRGKDSGPPRGGDRDDKPRGKTGWDGKPREKKFFRKED